MSLRNVSNSELISRLEKLVRTERKITHLVLLHVLEIEERKLYAEMGFDSMYSYLTRGLGYSESSAYRRLQSARLLKKIPAVAEKLEEGSLNLSQLTQVQKCLKEQTQKSGKTLSTMATSQILERLENKNSYETEKVLAIEFNRPIQSHESIKPQKDESVRVEFTLNKEQMAELEQARSLLSHTCPEGTWSEVISYLAKNFNQKKLQVRQNEQSNSTPRNLNYSSVLDGEHTKSSASASNSFLTQSFAATENSRRQVKRPREYISIYKKRELLRKAQYCCEYSDPKTGTKCISKYQLQVDHVKAWAHGGGNNIGNLRILCRTHNTFAASQAGLSLGK